MPGRADKNKLVFDVEDWDGRPVLLYQAQWKHICRNHPEMAEALESIRATIGDPDVVTRSTARGRHPEAARYVSSRRNTHPRYRDLYVRVPIEYGPQGNWVTTAYLNPTLPDGDLEYVRIAPH